MTSIGVIGAGVMGAGIAQLAASHGCDVVLSDVSATVVEKAIASIGKTLDRLVEKSKLTPEQKTATLARLHAAAGPANFAGCDLVIEAVAERLGIKLAALSAVKQHTQPATIFASNTSSLSISEIGAGLGDPARVVGMHFFNPAPLMPLVEVIRGNASDPAAVAAVAAAATSWGKTVVHAKDTPGFIVNRVARGYYLESLRMLSEGIAGIEEIDRTMRNLGGFRMGPFELMDLVGIDVNYGVSESVWKQLGRPARLMPNPIQADLYQKGELGRKTKRGFYSYEKEPPEPVVRTQRRPMAVSTDVANVVAAFVSHATSAAAPADETYMFARVLVVILNEAALAFDDGVATKADIDTAMRLGTNYPRGPWEWIAKIGADRCSRLLNALNTTVGDGRFAPANSLSEPSP